MFWFLTTHSCLMCIFLQAVEEKMRIAEAERRKMEDRLRLREMSTSDGMRRPLPTHNPDPFVTHRGKGKDACFGELTMCRMSVDIHVI